MNVYTQRKSIVKNKTEYSNFGTSSGYSDGQQLKSLFDINNNGPLLYNPTDLDKQNILSNFSSIFSLYPNLTNYVYLSEEFPQNSETIILNSEEFPIFKYDGKCFGNIEYFNAGPQDIGQIKYLNPQQLSFYYSSLFTNLIYIPESININSNKYPYSGLLYSGNLVQLKITNQNNIQNIKIIPYQSGRGIPQYDPTQEYFSGNAYGIPFWTEGIKIKPELSMGCVPGNNDACLGLVIDTEIDNLKNRIYNYSNDNSTELNNLPWIKWDQHPAPFTAPPENISFTQTQRIFSPENSNDNYYAPWPEYYAYKENDAVPIIKSGIVSVAIGAASNIGAMAYYEPDVEEGDNPINNPNYVAISTVPLFQGEEIKVGSNIYASCMGNIITPEPKGSTYSPVPSYDDSSGMIYYYYTEPELSSLTVSNIFLPGGMMVQRDARRDNPYYDFFDTTYGTCGWTSTPQFRLRGIPDLGNAIIESRNNINLDYLNQSNQGSAIVHALTTTNPLDEGGSGRMNLLGSPEYFDDLNEKFRRITKLPATPGRSLSIGKSFECIKGTGQWTYKGTLNNLNQTNFIQGATYTTGQYNVTGGSGNGIVVSIDSVDSNGTITGTTLDSPGSGYTDGDILTLTDPDPTTLGTSWAKGTIDYFKNCGTVIYNNGNISSHTSGSNYTSSSYVEGFNITSNNMIVRGTASKTIPTFPVSNNFTSIQNRLPINFLNGKLFSYLFEVEIFSYNTDNYIIGDLIAIINDANPQNWAIYELVRDGSNNVVLSPAIYYYNTGSSDFYFNGGRNVYQEGTYLYATKKITFSLSALDPIMRITCTNGSIDTIEMVNIPERNYDGDLILVNQKNSDKNCIFQLDANLNNISNFSTKLIKGGADYGFRKLNITDINNGIEYLPSPPPDYPSGYPLSCNICEVVDLNGNVQDINVFITTVSNSTSIGLTSKGSILNAKFELNINQSFSGIFGNYYLIRQRDLNIPVTINGISDPAVEGSLPLYYCSFLNQTATFLLEPRLFIKQKGSGYSIGTFNISGGSGTGMTVNIFEVDSNGGIVQLEVENIGQNYVYLDSVDIVGGNNDATLTLKLLTGWEIYLESTFKSPSATNPQIVSKLYWDFEIINPGTNYTTGTRIKTFCPQYEPSSVTSSEEVLRVNILEIGSSGEILDLEIIYGSLPSPDQTTIPFYQKGYKLTIIDGDENAIIQLKKPIKAKPFTFHEKGNNYTTATNVSTFNFTQNSAIVNAATLGGNPLAFVVNGNIGDKSRYNVGDDLAVKYLDNISATLEITAINNDPENSYNIGSVVGGAGYPENSLYHRTLNLTKNPTTVDIIADNNGFITDVSINTLGDDVRYGDYLVIEQVGSANNAVFRIESERDVPAPWQPFVNGREATASEWNNYKNVLKNSTNLLKENILFDMKKSHPNYYNLSWNYYGDPNNKDPQTTGVIDFDL